MSETELTKRKFVKYQKEIGYGGNYILTLDAIDKIKIEKSNVNNDINEIMKETTNPLP